jgi:hypothetical protein
MCVAIQLPVWASGWTVFGDPPGPGVFEEVVFEENFDQPDNSLPDPARWVIGHPEDDDGWWILGRTFFPNPAQHPTAPFPHVIGGALVIEHYQYNAFHLIPPRTTFLGGEIHTVMEFDPNRCYRFEARVRWLQSPGGMVSSFFTYGYDAVHADSDEIDVELLSNEVFEPPHPVLTNTWNDSRQKPVAVSISELDLTQWQTFRIYWYPGARVEWTWIDGAGNEQLLRSETDVAFTPDEPMSLYFNFWAADTGWLQAYNADLQPDQQDNGVKYEYWIDRVEVRVAREICNGLDDDCNGQIDELDACDGTGACCLPDGDCVRRTETECNDAEGTFQGSGTTCDDDPCGICSPMPRSMCGASTCGAVSLTVLGIFCVKAVSRRRSGARQTC